MRRAVRVAAWLAVLSAACGGAPPPKLPPPTTAFPADAPVARVEEQKVPAFDANLYRTAIAESVEAMLVAQPTWATTKGDHRFDDAWPDLTAEGEAKVADDFRARAQGLRAIAASVPATTTDAAAETDRPALDAAILADQLDAGAYERTALRPLERDPSWVLSLVGTGLSHLVAHPFAPKHDQLTSVDGRLAKVPALLAAARARVKTPTRASMENLGIVAPALARWMRGELLAYDKADLAGDAPLGARLAKHASAAAAALDAYAADLAKAYPLATLHNAPIGAEAWGTLARLKEGVLESPADVRKMGEAELARLEAQLDALIASPENKGSKKGETRAQLIARLEADAPAAAKVLDDYRAANKGVEEWLRGHAFVTVPWDRVKLEIVPTPPHMRGTTFASMNTAGPLDAIEDARFEVNAPDDTMPPARRSALLHFHAHGAIELVSLHEALPGHYLQLLHQRKTPSKVRRLLWATTMGEGWAHYVEQAAVDDGYTGGDAFRTRAFMLRMALQRAARVVVDVAENDGSMTFDQAAKFLEEHALLAPEAARIEARRAIVAPVNMFSYAYGKLAIQRLYERVKARDKDKFDPVSFHDRLLSIGCVPIRYAGPAAFGLD